MTTRKPQCLWLGRDGEGFGSYCIFESKPKKRGLLWLSRGLAISIRPAQSPVKLRPGEGPVKVRLVVE